jgi:hypothetical protein
MFRTMKSILETRPIYHKRDETIRGHVFCSFLALLLRRALEQRLEEKGETSEWRRSCAVWIISKKSKPGFRVSALCYAVRCWGRRTRR